MSKTETRIRFLTMAGIAMATSGCLFESVYLPLAKSELPGLANEQGYRVFWGDAHSHSSYSGDFQPNSDGEAPLPPDSLFRNAGEKDLDFAVVTDHSEDLTPEEWESTKEMARAAESGTFIPFLGYEFCRIREDQYVQATNVVFPTLSGGPVYGSTSQRRSDTDPRTLFVDSEAELWAKIDRVEPEAVGFAVSPGIPFDWNFSELEKRKVIGTEIASTDAHSREQVYQASVVQAMRSGFAPALLGTSNDHRSRPGEAALTAVLAKDFTREGIFDALRRKRTYASRGHRIALSFDANGRLMGDTLKEPVDPVTGRLVVRLTFSAAYPGQIIRIVNVRRSMNGKITFVASKYTNSERAAFSLPDTLAENSSALYWAEAYLQRPGALVPPDVWTSPVSVVAEPTP